MISSMIIGRTQQVDDFLVIVVSFQVLKQCVIRITTSSLTPLTSLVFSNISVPLATQSRSLIEMCRGSFPISPVRKCWSLLGLSVQITAEREVLLMVVCKIIIARALKVDHGLQLTIKSKGELSLQEMEELLSKQKDYQDKVKVSMRDIFERFFMD